MSDSTERLPSIAIAGIGGSGTRLIAQIVREAGVDIGTDINVSNDNRLFSLLFRRPELFNKHPRFIDQRLDLFITLTNRGIVSLTAPQLKLLQSIAQTCPPQFDQEWVNARMQSINKLSNTRKEQLWGWKEPNTYVYIDRIKQQLPNLKYVHVMRNGLDMAYSNNQNQLINWGHHYFPGVMNISPENSLRFWCAVHRKVINVYSKNTENFYLLNYDKFCTNPEIEIPNFLRFLQVDNNNEVLAKCISMVKPPESIGRHKNYSCEHFSQNDIAYVKELGFI